MDDVMVFIVSSDRASNVPEMETVLAGLNPLWVVPETQGATYAYCDAKQVMEVKIPDGSMALPTQRNAALDLARYEQKWCVQFNDDLRRNAHFPTGLNLLTGTYPDLTERPITPTQAITYLKGGLIEHDACFGGIATTTNKYFYRSEWSTQKFIMAHLMVMAPGCLEAFDPEMGVKEDYDFTLQHLDNHGIALRADGLMGNFRHNESRGGCAGYRTLAYEKWMADRLVERWGANVIHNKRREGEVLIKWKG